MVSRVSGKFEQMVIFGLPGIKYGTKTCLQVKQSHFPVGRVIA